jgi:hypothetical protein
LGILALLGLSLVAVAAWPVQNRAHPDGAGALGSLGVPVHDGMRVDPASGDSEWAFGVPLCLASAGAPAVLEAVSPVRVDGDGFEYLGSRVRTFAATDDNTPVISIGGWPPPEDAVPDRLSPVAGYEVSTPCLATSPGPSYTELLLGFQRVGSEGGGWEGIYVGYSVNGDRKVLQIDHDMKICGTRVNCEIESQDGG